MEYKDKDCANCRYSHHYGNRCMFTNRGCHKLDKWVPNEAVKLRMIKEAMKEIIELIDLV